MKKLIMIITLILFVGVNFSQAQDRIVDRTLGSGYSLFDYDGVAADTLGTAVDSIDYTLLTNKNRPLLHNIQVELDTVATIDGTVTADIKLYGRVYTTDSWSEVDATNTGVDVTVPQTIDFYSELAGLIDTTAANTEAFYRQFKVEITLATTTGLDAGEKVEVDWIYWKFYER